MSFPSLKDQQPSLVCTEIIKLRSLSLLRFITRGLHQLSAVHLLVIMVTAAQQEAAVLGPYFY